MQGKLITCLILLCCLASCSHEKNPLWREVQCSECNGRGMVTYGLDHWMVESGLVDPGTYACPMCRGEGLLYEEIR